MAIVNNWSESDIPCIVVSAFTPLTAISTIASAFTFDVNVSGGTVNTVTVFWGDGSNDPAAVTVAPEYTASHTYAAAGQYLVKVVTLLTTGETDEEWYIVTVS